VSGVGLQAGFPALGTTAVVLVADPRHAGAARTAVEREIAEIDRTCSRFRPDSELLALNAWSSADSHSGRGFAASPTLFEAVRHALRAARLTDGLVDPTLGRDLREVGYDRDFAAVPPDGPPLVIAVRRRSDWSGVRLHSPDHTITMPRGVELDLGATAKAWCADRAALAAAEATGTGVLVSLGGDISVAGAPPAGGWSVHVTDDHAAGPDSPGEDVLIAAGGLATSSTTVRHWARGGEQLHHLLDPATGRPARVWWRTVSVAAGTCVDANIATTASILLGPDAVAWLTERGLPARLVHADGSVVTVAGWPEDDGTEPS
jgi:thiamine biosynthesis lipoprotein